jgi:DNA-binding IclR family transcriptional regulator
VALRYADKSGCYSALRMHTERDNPTPATRDTSVLLTVEKTLRLLSLFDVEHQQWSIRELREATGESKTNILRITKTLEKLDYLERDPSSGKMRLGSSVTKLSYVTLGHSELVLEAAPMMRTLCDALKQTVSLSVEIGPASVMLLYHVTHRFLPALRPTGGIARPGLTSAASKVLFAFRPETIWDTILAEPIQPRTERTITDPDRLRQQLIRAREEAIAFDYGEWNVELGGVSAPVFGPDGSARAAMSIVVPIAECEPTEMDLRATALRRVAADLSEQLGAPLERVALLKNRSR